jgi:hypothetical protein
LLPALFLIRYNRTEKSSVPLWLSWHYVQVIPVPGELRQKDPEFKATVNYKENAKLKKISERSPCGLVEKFIVLQPLGGTIPYTFKNVLAE